MNSGGMVGIVTPGVTLRAVRRLVAIGPTLVLVEDSSATARVEALGGCRSVPASDLVSGICDIFDPAVKDKTIVLLRRLAEALGAAEWRYAEVSVWDAVQPDFLWRHLDSVFQAVDAAKQLLDKVSPDRLLLTGTDSYLARAVVAVARVRGISVEVLESRTPRWVSALRARAWPYLGHLRDCVWSRRVSRRLHRTRNAPFVLLNHALRNFQVVQPVFRELQCKVSQDRLLVVQTGTDGERDIRAAGFACGSFEGYVEFGEGLRALAAITEPMKFLTSGRWKKQVAMAGITWEGIPVDTLAEAEISFELPQLLGNAVREIACAHCMLTREDPALVILTEDRSSFGRAVGFSARAAGIPCLMIQWGPIASCSVWQSRVAADVVAVEGETAAEVIRACDDGEDVRVVVTGQPKYDELRRQAAGASRTDTCGRFGLDPERPMVLYAAHPISEESARMRRNHVEERKLADEVVAIVHAIRALPGVQLIVKPHPNEGSEFHREALERYGNPDVHLISQKEPIYPLLFVCDAVVTHRSTVGLEGVLLDKPLVIVNLTGRPDAFPYVESGVALGAYSAAEVRPAIHAVLYDAQARRRMEERRPSFLHRYAARDGVSATDRMTNLMLELARSNGKKLGFQPSAVMREVGACRLEQPASDMKGTDHA